MEYTYRDFKVICTKEKSLDGSPTIYYNIYDSDGIEVVSGFTRDSTPLKKYAIGLKEVVDDIIKNPEDYYDDEYSMYDDYLSCGCCACCGCSCDDDWEDFDDY